MTLFETEQLDHEAAGPVVRVRMTVAYDGSGFHGFAPNPGVPTVGGTLAAAIGRVARVPVALTCAGRTDTGVHAWGQVVSFDLAQAALGDRFDLVDLQRGVNRQCSPGIVVRDVAEAPDDFDARRSATGRTYRYTVLNRELPDPFLAHLAWHVDRPLDLDLLRLACDPLVGTHDFSAFCRRSLRRDGTEAPLVRDVRRAGWFDLGEGVLRFEIEANAFCHQMIRSVVGTLVEAGSGKRHAGEILGVVASRDRSKAGALAPPHGLCLWSVSYPE